MAESMKDYETELEASFKKIEEGDILTGTVISVDEKEVVVDLKYYAEGIIPAEDYSREPGFSLKEWRRDRLCRRCTWIYSRLKACPELCGGYKRISEQTNPGSGFRY